MNINCNICLTVGTCLLGKKKSHHLLIQSCQLYISNTKTYNKKTVCSVKGGTKSHFEEKLINVNKRMRKFLAHFEPSVP